MRATDRNITEYTIALAVMLVAGLVWATGATAAAQSAEDSPDGVKPQSELRLVVTKSARTLEVFDGDELKRRYAIGLGFAPRGDKRRQGDGRTPEGRYRIAVKNPRSRYFLSLGLSYPGPLDASRAYIGGRIAWGDYRAIVKAAMDERRPPWNTPLGGAIMIHGHGAKPDWTDGCIALDNADILELYKMVEVGTPVRVRP